MNKRKHIALVAPLLVKSATGPSFYIADLVPRLCEAGYEVTVLASDCINPGGTPDEFVTIDSRAHLKLFRVKGRLNRRVCRVPEMVRWLRKNAAQIDVVDIQGIWYWVTADIARECQHAGIPYVITPHGMMGRWDWAKKPLVKRIYFSVRLRNSWRYAAAIRFLSAGELDSCMIPPASPVAMIPTAVDLPCRMDMEAGARVKARLMVPQNTSLVVFLGRVTPQKGVYELVRAFDLVSHRCPEAVLAIAGRLDGDYGRAVQECAAQLGSRDKIHILGSVSPDEKADLLCAASVFVTLSRNEGLSSAVLEALGNCVPVVVTKDSNLPEVREYSAGIVTEVDIAKAADAIATLLLQREERNKMGANAQRLISERFTWISVLPKLMALYDQIASRGTALELRCSVYVNAPPTPESLSHNQIDI